MTRPGRAALVTVAALVALASATGLVGTGRPAAAATNAACTDNTGVTVVIDFHELGGGVQVRCAAQPVTDGFSALRQAGIDYQTTVRFPGFLCRIAGQPSSDPCINTSPASAYWSYWLAPRGGSWCYSNLGAGSRTPPPGAVEGWSFAKDKVATQVPPPGYAPPPAIPGATPHPLGANDCGNPATSADPPSSGGSHGAGGAAGGGAAAPAAGTAAAPPGLGPAAHGGSSAAGGGPATTDSSGAGGSDPGARGATARAAGARTRAGGTDAVADPAIDLGHHGPSGPSPLGVGVTLALVAVLAGAAIVLARRRRASVGDGLG